MVLLEVKNLKKGFGSKAFKTRIEVLKGINLKIKRGELVALMGPSGCGWLLYIAYFVYRRQPDTLQVKKNSAILGLSGMLMVPLSYLSSRFLRSHHPVIVGTEDQGSLDPSLRFGLYLGLFGFLLIFIFLFKMRMEIENLERDIFRSKMERL